MKQKYKKDDVFFKKSIISYGGYFLCKSLSAYDNKSKKFIGGIDYVIYDDSVYIDIVEVAKGLYRKGIGTILVKEMIKSEGFDYSIVDWGVTTAKGRQLKNHMDKIYLGGNYVKS